MEYVLQYFPFDSDVDPSFWHKFAQIKLDIDKLNENERFIWGYYSIYGEPSTNPELLVDCSSFNTEFSGTLLQFPAHGTLINKNTVEAFKDSDKTALLAEHGRRLWDDIVSGAALVNPTLLNRFIVLSYADLKKYKFYSWFAFPAPNLGFDVYFEGPPKRLNKVLNMHLHAHQISEWQTTAAVNHRSFFTLHVAKDGLTTRIGEIGEVANEPDSGETYVVYCDPKPSGDQPGWPLRNLLLLVSVHCPHLVGRRLSCVGLRSRLVAADPECGAESRVYDVIVPPPPANGAAAQWVGWERNERGKFGPRVTDLQTSMSPRELSAAAVDLNLKLMKWRLCPDLDLERIRETRCLLLGAGTLGCSVARNLMAWGVRHITFVDNGYVSYSNPVRQSLYAHSHCLDGGQHKALAAVQAVQDIFPGVMATGVVQSIPMPGHPIGESLRAETLASVVGLERLVDQNDAVFLLMDSRESRWLPTLVAASKGKIVMNAALGFDTYLVMRHGTRPRMPIVGQSSSGQPIAAGDSASRPTAGHGSSSQPIPEQGSSVQPIGEPCSSSQPIPGDQLGCYFCNDVTAPGNSQLDRSLDQQCTVARPGVSGIASALVVELFVSLLQHPDMAGAPADDGRIPSTDSCVLGLVPHTIRGFLSQYQQVLPSCRRFPSCIACSDKVVSEYESRGFDFLTQVFNTPNYLEDLTGLTKMKAETADTEIWELDSNSSEDME